MGASVSRGPLEVCPKSLVNHSLALPRVAGCFGGHTDGQRIASHELEEQEAEFWKQGVDCTQTLQPMSYAVSTALRAYIPHGPSTY